MSAESFKIKKSLNLEPGSPTMDTEGDVGFDSSTHKLKIRDNSATRNVVTEDGTATLTNKTIDADSNTITNIENADIKAAAAIAHSKIADITAGSVLMGNGSNVPTATALSGDVTVNSSGVTAIGSGVIVNADVNASAAIDHSKMAALTASRAMVTDASGVASASSVTATTLGYLDATSSIQTQLNAKAPTASPTFSGTITTPLTASRALTTGASSELAASSVTATELGYVSGVTSAIQTQLDGKAASSHNHAASDINSGTLAEARGGTNQSTYTTGDLLYASASNTLSKLTIGSTGQSLKVSGSGVPEWGAAGGAGGVNFLGLNSSWQLATADDRDAETSVGNWAEFDDGAVSSPVDMTGGTAANIALSRTTTAGELLNGSGSFKIVKDAADAQGEGVSCVAYVPLAYRTSSCTIRFPFKVTSGSLVDGDLKVFVYDVTNSQVITPFNNSVVGTQGEVVATCALSSTTAQIRVGLMFASTSTTAVTICFDDVSIGPVSAALGMAATDLVSYTPTISGGGTIASQAFQWQQVGDCYHIIGKFVIGTPTGAITITLPNSVTIDSTKISSSNYTDVGWGSIVTVGYYRVTALAQGGLSTLALGLTTGTNYSLTPYANWGVGETISINAWVPITGKSSNVTMAASSTFRISNYLASGTRVTAAAPDALGEYRSYLRNASSYSSFTETNGSPGTTPSATSGMLLYGGNAFNANDSNNEPSRYEIFVGKNKHVKFQFFSGTGFTGDVDVTTLIGGSKDYGVRSYYDPTTGIASVTAFRFGGTTTTHDCGIDKTGVEFHDVYFDIIVSENALAVGVQSPRSEILLDTVPGTGSGNTLILRWTNSTSTGNAYSKTSDSTNGDYVTILEDGVYNFSLTCAGNNAVAFGAGITKNYSTNTAIGSIPAANRIAWVYDGATTGQRIVQCSGSVYCAAGTTIRWHVDNGSNVNASSGSQARITKVSN